MKNGPARLRLRPAQVITTYAASVNYSGDTSVGQKQAFIDLTRKRMPAVQQAASASERHAELLSRMEAIRARISARAAAAYPLFRRGSPFSGEAIALRQTDSASHPRPTAPQDELLARRKARQHSMDLNGAHHLATLAHSARRRKLPPQGTTSTLGSFLPRP